MKPEKLTQATVPLTNASADSENLSRGTRFWIAASLIVPVVVIGWACTIGRHDGAAASAVGRASQNSPVALSPSFVVNGESPAEVQALAREVDAKLMKRLAKRRAADGLPVPGLLETKTKWQQKARRVQSEVSKFPDAKEGTIEWVYQKELIESLQDGPS